MIVIVDAFIFNFHKVKENMWNEIESNVSNVNWRCNNQWYIVTILENPSASKFYERAEMAIKWAHQIWSMKNREK